VAFQSLFIVAGILWSIPFLALHVFGVQLYLVKDSQKVQAIKSKVKTATINVNGDDPGGVFLGFLSKKRMYVGWIRELTSSNGRTSWDIWMISSKDTFNELSSCRSDDLDITNPETTLVLWYRSMLYWNLEYSKRMVPYPTFHPTPIQSETIREIMGIYHERNNGVFYLHGKPGTGKSTVPAFLAKNLGGTIVEDFDPTTPGDSFYSLLSNVGPKKESPLIIVLDEFDAKIRKIHEGIEPHKHIVIPVRDKPTWNNFLDQFDRKYAVHVILLLLSNVSPETLSEETDPAYIRPKRVHKYFSFD